MILIKSKYGWLMDFDGEDFRWTDDKAKAWRMTEFEANLTGNRLDAVRVAYTREEV